MASLTHYKVWNHALGTLIVAVCPVGHWLVGLLSAHDAWRSLARQTDHPATRALHELHLRLAELNEGLTFMASHTLYKLTILLPFTRLRATDAYGESQHVRRNEFFE